MRKISVIITTMILAVAICLSSLLGCSLITTNNERDMNQVVATVQIEQGAPKKTIYKRDLWIAYLSYYYSGSVEDYSAGTFSALVEDLINNAVTVQYAMKYFAEKPEYQSIVNDQNKWDVNTYLNDEEKLDVKYNAYKDFYSLIKENVTEKEEEKSQDSYLEEVRVAPTGAVNSTELSDAQKQAFIDKVISEIANEKYNAFVKTINYLKTNQLLGDYDNVNVETIEYFKEVLSNYQENKLAEKFQNDFEKTARSIYTYQDIADEYARLYAAQKDFTVSEFESALAEESSSTPILYGLPGYGRVYHVLLKASDSLTKELADLKSKYQIATGTPAYENAQYSADRAELFDGKITAKDLRSSWIYAGYDFGADSTDLIEGFTEYNKTFTGDYTLYKNFSLPYFGKVAHINEHEAQEENYSAQYRIESTKEFSLQELLALINEYVYDGTATTSDNVTYTATKVNEGYEDRIKELMFAFSEDSSDEALNTYNGYAIKPTPDGTTEEEWMQEFAEEGRSLITADQKTFKVVITDYGYHIMFFSANYGNYDYPTLTQYLNAKYGEKNWEEEYQKMLDNWTDYEDTDNYMYILHNALSATYVNSQYAAKRQEILRDYIYNSNVVYKNEKAYQDLIED